MALDDVRNSCTHMNRLEFDSIELCFGSRTLLTSIYMLCETGSITGLLGRNGSGKSSLMKVVFGSIGLTQRSVRINGRTLGPDYLRKRLIAYLPQSDLIPPYVTIAQAYSLMNVHTDALTGCFPEAEDMLELRPSQLSGGYLRAFELVLVLHTNAMFCLLDEPFTGLSPAYVEKVKGLIRKVRKTKGIVISDHLYRHVEEISDRLYLLANGQTYAIKDREQLLSLGYLSALA